jgi:hypothetical protein
VAWLHPTFGDHHDRIRLWITRVSWVEQCWLATWAEGGRGCSRRSSRVEHGQTTLPGLRASYLRDGGDSARAHFAGGVRPNLSNRFRSSAGVARPKGEIPTKAQSEFPGSRRLAWIAWIVFIGLLILLPVTTASTGNYLGAASTEEPSGWLGGILAVSAIFLPAFLLILGAVPFWNVWRRHPSIRAAINGVNAALSGFSWPLSTILFLPAPYITRGTSRSR